jgi:sugar phosphate isomerase/epimerase
MTTSIDFFCPHWGSDKLPFETFLNRVKDAGYQGVEMSLPLDDAERTSIVKAIADHDLKLVCQHWETVNPNFSEHRVEFENRLRNLAKGNPVLINTQTGKDHFSFEQNAELIQIAAKVAADTGFKIVHETHRGKFSFAAHITAQFLDKLPELELGLDISHWCCVAETMLEDQTENVDKALKRSRHIHSRVGHIEGPQVMDPRAPEWASQVERHVGWWQQVVANNATLGLGTTITTEFGPAPYLQHLPYTNVPIYDQWEVNVYMLNLLKAKL